MIIKKISIFPSFEQVKQLHQELSKLMKEIEELENVPAEDKTELLF
jgi:PHP family Zn ribbon phosphoesterase